MENQDEFKFFDVAYEILSRHDLYSLDILIIETKKIINLCNYKLITAYLITNYNLLVSYILRNDVGIDFYSIDKDILEKEIHILKSIKSLYYYSKTEDKDNFYFDNMYAYFELLKTLIVINDERINFGDDNYNEGRTMLNKLRINGINDKIEEAQELAKYLKRSLTVENI